MQTISFTARKNAALLFLICSAEIEFANICTRVNIATTHAQQFIAATDNFVDRLFRNDVRVLLVDIGKFDSFSDFKVTTIWRLQAHDHTEKRCLSGTIRPYYSNDTTLGQRKVEIVEQDFLSISL